MTISLEVWHIVTLAVTVLGAFLTGGKLFFEMFKNHVDERFKIAADARNSIYAQMDKRFETIETAHRNESAQWLRVERKLMDMKAQMPREFVRREDYVQQVATILTKLDNMQLRTENILLKGGQP